MIRSQLEHKFLGILLKSDINLNCKKNIIYKLAVDNAFLVA